MKSDLVLTNPIEKDGVRGNKTYIDVIKNLPHK